MQIDIHSHNAVFEPKFKKHFNLIIGSNEDVLKIDLENNPYCSAGVHPWYINEVEVEKQFQLLRDVAKNPNVKIIGEAGLDKIQGANFVLQEEVFIKQIKLAEELKKPIIIHCVKSFSELSAIKKVVRPKIPMIVHGFNRKADLALSLQKEGFYLSFGAAILNNTHVQEALINVDLSKVFLETDDSTVSISEIYIKATELLKIEIGFLEEKIYDNYLELFI
jgi:TatD DNase family protein